MGWAPRGLTLEGKLRWFGWKVQPSGCWEWQGGSHDKWGYGVMRFEGKNILTHRAAYIVWRGEITEPFVLHRCDNPPCMNPAHLFLGDNAINMADKKTKGRASLPKGFRLRQWQIDEIVQAHQPYSELAVKYGVSSSTIGNIKTATNPTSRYGDIR